MSMTLFEQEVNKIHKDYLRGIITYDEYTQRLDDIGTCILIVNEVD